MTYDNNSNTLTKNDSTETRNYTWDFENRLTSLVLPGSAGMVTFGYDPFWTQDSEGVHAGRNGEYVPLLYNRKVVEGATEKRITLVPEGLRCTILTFSLESAPGAVGNTPSNSRVELKLPRLAAPN